MHIHKKRLILALIVLLVFISGCGQQPPDPPDNGQGDYVPPDPVVLEPALPGALLTIVENHSDARPQSGLDQADIVYEMVSEGSITRFLAVFYWKSPEKIGPVRSVRPAFTNIAKAYDSPLVHAGGSTAGLASVRSLGIENLDEIYNASRAFWRSSDRRMPHNLYTSAQRILDEAERKDYTISPPPALPLGENEDGKPTDFLEVTYSRSYTSQFTYKSGRYYKKVNGRPFTNDTGAPLSVSNVIVMVIRTTYEKADGNTYSNIHLIGSGDAYFFSDGKVHTGTWSKSGPESHFQYKVGDNPYQFQAGKTWVQIIPSADDLVMDYTPKAPPLEPDMG